MKPGQYALFAVAGLAVAGSLMMATKSDEVQRTSADKAQARAKGSKTDGKASAGASAEANPEVFFLDEAGTQAPGNRPRANMVPKANGTARIGEIRAITSADEGDFMAPRWSPDGLELMFSKAGYSGLYTKGIMGGEINQVTGKDNIGYGAEWTKDGKIVAKNNEGEKQAFNPDGSPASSVDPVDDSSITGAFNSNDTVFYRPNPGEAPIPVSAGEDRYYGGVVSPDGKYIAYNGLETGIYIKPLDGSGPAVHVGYGTHPTFLPDSSGIVYTVTQDDGHNLVQGDLYMSSLDGRTISDLTGNSPAIETKPSVSPDGRKIAFEADGTIYVGSFQ